jgi:hypothetical protein
MDPDTYLLLEGAAFTIPPNPGPTAIFPSGAVVARTAMKTIQATFNRDKNYYLSHKNIMRACFCMLDANVLDQFKVSNNPTLMGWNSMMSIIDILGQLHCTQTTHCSAAQWPPAICQRCSSTELSNAKKSNA